MKTKPATTMTTTGVARRRAIVGNDAVLIDKATNVVLDVIRNVVNKGGQTGQ
ncbi:MAG: hypothetical protein VW169_06805 [Rhodospirillaceae bacterium]|jgi:hypothetical protein